MIIESAHALEDGVVDTAAELDMALLLGLGFPPYLGGALKYADWLGLERVLALSVEYADLGPLYQHTAGMRAMAERDQHYYDI
jgi:3-hydroxyacyl-CoA dehydrogenase / enoyl-CoA hydratase / 3-hydroxybutyryl-CoA epimerase / enoyl-CoA isomerase